MTIPDTFPAHGERINPHLSHARAQNVAWLRKHGILLTQPGVDHFLGLLSAETAAALCPDACTGDLRLATDAATWMIILDDVLGAGSPYDGDHLAAGQICTTLLETFMPAPSPGLGPLPPLVTSFRDLWKRERAGMSQAWCARAGLHWREFIQGTTEELHLRAMGTQLTMEQYLQCRRRSSGIACIADVDERLGGYELPEQVWARDFYRDLHRLFVDTTVICNDLYGYAWEEARGESANCVLLLEHELGLPRTDTVAHVEALRESTLQRFRTTGYHDVPAHLAQLNLQPEQHAGVLRHVDSMHKVIGCIYRYTQTAPRYREAPKRHETWQPRYLTDLFEQT
ncbi:hypothetical protein [Streptomyces sp. MNP-20]|uniref:terpene synthase family protein n=1 Tax=Streptomyces sp. MNP-20 TaxID=2721165 RepID=UPI001557A196|nr:hypothetical protein [Streptomyces sp. MNP-20]